MDSLPSSEKKGFFFSVQASFRSFDEMHLYEQAVKRVKSATIGFFGKIIHEKKCVPILLIQTTKWKSFSCLTVSWISWILANALGSFSDCEVEFSKSVITKQCSLASRIISPGVFPFSFFCMTKPYMRDLRCFCFSFFSSFCCRMRFCLHRKLQFQSGSAWLDITGSIVVHLALSTPTTLARSNKRGEQNNSVRIANSLGVQYPYMLSWEPLPPSGVHNVTKLQWANSAKTERPPKQ